MYSTVKRKKCRNWRGGCGPAHATGLIDDEVTDKKTEACNRYFNRWFAERGQAM